MKNNKINYFTLLAIILFTSCNTGKDYFPPVLHYLEPTEEHLWDATYFVDFVNHSDDWSKLGLKGRVQTVEYSTLHPVRWVFRPNGKLQNVTYKFGENPQEMKEWYFYYDNDSLLKHTLYDEQIVRRNRKPRKFKGNPVDEIVCHANGKPDTHSFVRFNNEVTKQQYHYNDDGICTSTTLTYTQQPDFDMVFNEIGQVVNIKLKQIRIPVHGLTRGTRNIIPTYDDKGRISTITSMSVPQNMEAYNIDSIFNTSTYEYNENNDIILWHYNDTVYPQKYNNSFDVSFHYVYDKQGNWIEKHIKGLPHIINSIMNSYYRDSYPVEYEETTEEPKTKYAKIILKRNITYFGQTDNTENQLSNESKDEISVKPSSKSALNGSIEFAAPNLKYWKIDKVTCSGPKNGGYEFVISGKYTVDCSNYSMTSRMVTVAVKEKSKMQVTSPGSYIFPVGKQGEQFTVEVVSAYDGMCNINDFQFLVLLQD